MVQLDVSGYVKRLTGVLESEAMRGISVLANVLMRAWKDDKTIYICGNGGSAANALHIANDLIYGAGISNGIGIKVEALTSNSAILTCLANDLSYEEIFSEQLKVKGEAGDILIVLSGSGNSPNIVNAVNIANSMSMKTFAILGYDGGKCKNLAHHAIHFEIDDMQITEDMQMIVGHICAQWLCKIKLYPNK